jgi:hypothetical protein
MLDWSVGSEAIVVPFTETLCVVAPMVECVIFPEYEPIEPPFNRASTVTGCPSKNPPVWDRESGDEFVYQFDPPSFETSNPAGGVTTTLSVNPEADTVYDCVPEGLPSAWENVPRDDTEGRIDADPVDVVPEMTMDFVNKYLPVVADVYQGYTRR